MRSLRFAFAVLAAAMAGLVSQTAVSSPAEAGSCYRASHHHAPKMKAHHHHHHAKPAPKKPAPKKAHHHHPKPKVVHMHHKPAPKKAHHHHHHVKAAPPARPGKCGTFKYYKGGKCLDARNKK